MGRAMPPYYGTETILKKIDKIAELDVKINELLVLREQYVADLKEAIKAEDTIQE